MKRYITLFGLVAFVFACKKPDYSKIKGFKWDPNLAAPIGYSEFDVYDILANKDASELVVINNLGEIALNYKGDVASYSADQIAQLTNQSDQIVLNLADQGATPAPAFSGSVSNASPQQINFNLSNGVQLTDLLLLAGTLDLGITTDLQHDVIFNLSFPDILKNGSPISYSLAANYAGVAPHSANGSIDLSGAQLDLTANGSAPNNTLRVNITTTVNGTGNPIVGNENSTIQIGFNSMQLDNAFGYFGQQAIVASSDSILLRIFDNTTTGVVQLTNPKLRFRVTNSFGIPVQLDVTNLKSINVNTGSVTPLTTNALSNITIPAAATLGDSSVTNLTELNTGNTSNMNVLVNNTPKYVNYTVNAITNPAGPATNFVSKDSKLNVHAELELPLEGYAYDFMITDTLPFNFSNSADQVEYVMFRLNSNNGFPISFNAQVEFLDSNNVSLFTLFTTDQEVLAAAPVDNDGRVTSKNKKITDITIPKNKIGLLANAKYAVIKGVAATTQPQMSIVKLFEDYSLFLKLSMQVQLKLGV